MRLRAPSTPLLVGGAVLASCLLRIALVSRVHGPWIFPDELGYEQVAVNLAHGHLALYGRTGLSYSPLYPLTLAPLFAAGLSATHAYEGIKIVNAILMSLALVPVYGIGRFLLPRRWALAVVALAALAPLMYTTALGMSENLAYPLFLVAAWLLLRTLAEPSRRNDALLLAAIVVACGARIQLIALVPAALTALVLLTLDDVYRRGRKVGEALRQRLREHRVLIAGCVLLVLAAALPALVGSGAFSVAGRYSNVPAKGSPSPVHIAKLFVYHAAGLVVVGGVLPFVGTLAVAGAWLRRRSGGTRISVFAVTGVALAVWLLAETAFAVNAFERQGDAPRIHERYLFYLVPFFLTALVTGLRRLHGWLAYAVATVVAALAILAIPFQTMINGTVVADSFSFEVFARNGTLQAVPHAALLGVAIVAGAGAVLLALHRRPELVLAVVAVVFVLMSSREATRVAAAAKGQHEFTSAARDWVDRAHPAGDVAMVVGPATTDPVAEWQTDYHNLSIKRLYFTCQATLSRDFGEQRVAVSGDGTVTSGGRPLRVGYAVVPSGLGVEGTVLARDPKAKLELVATGGTLRIASAGRRRWTCG